MKYLRALLLLIASSALATTVTAPSHITIHDNPFAYLSWTPVTTNTDGSAVTLPITYNIYQGPSGGTLVKVQSGLLQTIVIITTGLTPGSTQCFEISATEGSTESAHSNRGCKSYP